MRILGLETSCDECAAAVVEDGCRVFSSVVASQVEEHQLYDGVVPEIAARLHCEWIQNICDQALSQAGLTLEGIDAIAVTQKPGMIGALLVGLSFAKGLAWAAQKPLLAVDHILAHLYAPQLEQPIPYPYIGFLASGGHTLVCRVEDFCEVTVLGASIDDACGEAFDKVAKHYGLGYPGGAVIDQLARAGDAAAFCFPQPRLKQSRRELDLSFSGLKTAAIWQHKQFLQKGREDSLPNLLASYQKAIVDMLLDRLAKASQKTGISRVVLGGGVAANSYLRSQLTALAAQKMWQVHMPSLAYCTDNAAMIAGIGYQYALAGQYAPLDCSAYSRVDLFRSTPAKKQAALKSAQGTISQGAIPQGPIQKERGEKEGVRESPESPGPCP